MGMRWGHHDRRRQARPLRESDSLPRWARILRAVLVAVIVLGLLWLSAVCFLAAAVAAMPAVPLGLSLTFALLALLSARYWRR